MLSQAESILIPHRSMAKYWNGILALCGVMRHIPMCEVPLYRPFDGKPRFKFENNKVLVCYGAVYPWTDLAKTLETFKKFPKEYTLLIKGINHPLYKRTVGEFVLDEYLRREKKSVRDRITVDKTWDSKLIKCNALIYHTKSPEQEVSYPVRVLDAMSHGIWTITNCQNNVFHMFWHSGLVDCERDIKEIEVDISSEFSNSVLDSVRIDMEWLEKVK